MSTTPIEKQLERIGFSLSSPETVHFDADGDTRLLGQGTFGRKQVFVVSSKAMMLVCDAWDKMLNGHFKEAQPSDGLREIFLPDDNMDALTILLNIAHLRFDKVPATLTFRGLLDLAVLSDKYGTARALQPWLTRWLNSLEHTVGVVGHEEWLWIAWEFGEEKTFSVVSERLTREVCINDAGKCTNSAGKVLDSTDGTSYFPPDIVESITKVRAATIGRLLEACYSYLDKYLSMYTPGTPNTVAVCHHCGESNELACDARVFGSFVLSLRKIGLSTIRQTPDDTKLSINELSAALLRIEVLDCSGPGSKTGQSSNCNFTQDLKTSVWQILESIPSPILESHKRHMQRQQRHF